MIRAALLAVMVGATGTAAFAPAPPTPTAITVDDDEDTTESMDNAFTNPAGMLDGLFTFHTLEHWRGGSAERLAFAEGKLAGIRIADNRPAGFPRSGVWTSPATRADFPFTEMIVSWNLETPEDTGASFELRVRADGGEWSPWLYTGQWGKTLHSPERRLSFDGGEMAIDCLSLKAPAHEFQVRTRLVSFDRANRRKPTLRRLFVSYSGEVKDVVLREKLGVDKVEPLPVEAWAKKLRVPFIPQADTGKPISGSTCSPTSVTMVMAYRGVNRPLLENAMEVWDPEYGLFGNWNRAAARAGSFGLNASVRRFRTWDAVKAEIAKGNPVIASIRFGKGEFPSNVIGKTAGHLTVVIGFTPDGDPIMNDPASAKEGEGAVYKKDEMARAWFDKGGVGYLITKDLP